MPDIKLIQSRIAAAGFDGWLITDFRGSNAPGCRVLGAHPCSRRWWYWIPAGGAAGGADACVKLEPAVEVGVLASLPGTAYLISKYEQVESALRPLVAGKRVAMEYSPEGKNPYVSHVDGGTLERVRGCGATIGSSQDLLQYFDARWTDHQWNLHLSASQLLLNNFEAAIKDIQAGIASGKPRSEYDISIACGKRLAAAGCVGFGVPNTSNTEHSRLPHYEPPSGGEQGKSALLGAGELVLMDHICKTNAPDAVYADYTRVYFLGKKVPERFEKAFEAVVGAREAALSLVESAFKAGRPLMASEADLAARRVLIAAGYEKHIAHRTGHNLGASHVHGNGAHLDAVEHPDTRLLIPETAFTIEPGLYFPDFGVRSEINVYIDAAGKVHVTGARPEAIERVEV